MRVLMLTQTTPYLPTHDTLASNARQLVQRHYTWAAVARAYAALWARVADAALARTVAA